MKTKVHENVYMEENYSEPPRWLVGLFVAVCVAAAGFALGVMVGTATISEPSTVAMEGAVLLP